MQPQETAPEVIDEEKRVVGKLANLSDIDTISFDDSGWDSRVYMVNDGQYFVKFPRSEKIRERSANQIAALGLASGINSEITVPKVLWQDPDHRYFGYAGIQGTALAKALPTLDQATKNRIGTSLGNFLRQFHQLHLPEARAMDASKEMYQVQDWYEKGLRLSNQLFSKEEQTRLHTLVYDVWPTELFGLSSDLALCHSDFHFDNIFYSDEAGVGVIDFGDVCNADHSKDFADFGDAIIFEAALKAYDTNDKKLRDKIKLREDMTRIITMTAQLSKHGVQAAQETILNIKKSL